jgi:hypothetical protein
MHNFAGGCAALCLCNRLHWADGLPGPFVNPDRVDPKVILSTGRVLAVGEKNAPIRVPPESRSYPGIFQHNGGIPPIQIDRLQREDGTDRSRAGMKCCSR